MALAYTIHFIVSVILMTGLGVYATLICKDPAKTKQRQIQLSSRCYYLGIVGVVLSTVVFATGIVFFARQLPFLRDPAIALVLLPVAAVFITAAVKLLESTRSITEAAAASWISFSLGLVLTELILSVGMLIA